MIKQRFGFENKKPTEQNLTYENSCDSLGVSAERDLIGNLLSQDEQSIEDEILMNKLLPGEFVQNSTP